MTLDQNFDQTVVLMIEHNDEGALGVTLNRPLDLAVRNGLPEWADSVADPGVVFSGGPVGQGSVLALGEVAPDDAPVGFAPFRVSLGVIDLTVSSASDPYRRVRVFSGYSGWGPGQVEAEMTADAWFDVEALVDDVFTDSPDTLWSEVLRRQGGALGRVGLFPPDPGLN